MPEPDHISSTRLAYEHSAGFFVEQLGTRLSAQFETAVDRAMLDAFALDVLGGTVGPVLDVGCGSGRATAYLADRGVDIAGIDLAPAMVDAARMAHPDLSFHVGTLTDLPVADQSLAAAVYWYSIIHTPLDHLIPAWAELRRVLAPGGRALFAYQTGPDDHVVRSNAYGSTATLTRFHHDTPSITEALEATGFTIATRLWRAPELVHETTPQAIVVATVPA